MNSPSADRELEAFKAFAAELRTEDGDPFEVHQFQEMILDPFFEGCRSTVIIMPKKNGKTTLIAALALYHLLVTPNADCIIVASSREQAGICLKAARIFVRNSPQLSALMTINQRTIRLNGEEGSIRILASDEDTLDGENPTLAIVDELHRHKNLEVYGVLSDGMVRPGARMITISTAGSNLESPLGVIRTGSHKMPGFYREGKLNRVRTADFAFFEWCLEPGDDVENLDVVKMANPAPWQTIDNLRIRRTEQGMTLYRWLRFACGIWTEGEEPVISPPVWDALQGGHIAEGELVWIGVRVGQQGGCGIGIAAERDGQVAVRIEQLPYDFPGLQFALRRLCERYEVQAIFIYERQFGIGADVLEAGGLPLQELPQSPTQLMTATSTFLGLVSREELAHDGDPVLRSQVMKARMKETTTGAYLEPSSDTQALIGLIIAAHEAIKHAGEKPPRIHVYRGA